MRLQEDPWDMEARNTYNNLVEARSRASRVFNELGRPKPKGVIVDICNDLGNSPHLMLYYGGVTLAEPLWVFPSPEMRTKLMLMFGTGPETD